MKKLHAYRESYNAIPPGNFEMFSCLNEMNLCGLFKLNNGLNQFVNLVQKCPHKYNLFRCESISKLPGGMALYVSRKGMPMFRGHKLMLKTPESGGITWSWKQQLVGVNRTGRISWTIMKNKNIGKFSKILNNNKQVKMILFFKKCANFVSFHFFYEVCNWFQLSYLLHPTYVSMTRW